MARPVIFLDVDGVLNAVPHQDPDEVGFHDFQVTECAGMPITYSLEMGARLAALEADIIWVTTWEMNDLCNKLIAPLFSWPEFPILHAGNEWFRPGWWKSTVVYDYVVENQRHFIWIDDDLEYSVNKGEVDWLDDCIPLFKLVTPDTRTGITPSQLDEIETFIAEVEPL